MFSNLKKPVWNRSKGTTLRLWGEGLDIGQIAKRRNFEDTTIQAHLVDAVALGKLGVDQFVNLGDVEFVEEAFVELSTTDLTPIYSACEQIFDFFELSVIRAHLGHQARQEAAMTAEFQEATEGAPEEEVATHVIFLATRKKAHADSTGVKWVVAVRSIRQWQSIVAVRDEVHSDMEWRKAAKKLVFPRMHRQYSRILVDGEVRKATSQVQAFFEAYEWAADLNNGGRTAEVHGDRMDCRIYAFILYSEVWSKKRFKEANPHISAKERDHTLCLYVGQTSKSIEERYYIHKSNGKGSTTWGREFFVEDFSEAFDEDIQALIDEFESTFDGKLDMGHLTYGQSIICESLFGLWLREQGHATYFA